MALSETDLEVLDSYLDDELSTDEVETLRKRLSSEPELAQAMDQVRLERQSRQQFFSALEPDEAAVESLVGNIYSRVDRELLWARRARALRSVSGIAACLLVGFLGGYAVRGTPGTSQNAGFGGSSTAPSAVVSTDTQGANREIDFHNPTSKLPSAPPMQRGSQGNSQLVGYEVKLTDDAGNVIGTQRFATIEQAQQFANDITRMRKERNQFQQNGGVRLIGDQY